MLASHIHYKFNSLYSACNSSNVLLFCIGSMPIIFLIVPTVAAGALQLKVGGVKDNSKATADAILAVAGMVRAGALIAAAYFVERKAHTDAKFLREMPVDQEVLDADRAAAEERKLRDAVLVWHKVPRAQQVLLAIATVFALGSTVILQVFGDSCFQPFEVTTQVADPPFNGDVLAIVKPLGRASITVYIFSLLLLKLFFCWANRKVCNDPQVRQGAPLVHQQSTENVHGQYDGESSASDVMVSTRFHSSVQESSIDVHIKSDEVEHVTEHI